MGWAVKSTTSLMLWVVLIASGIELKLNVTLYHDFTIDALLKFADIESLGFRD